MDVVDIVFQFVEFALRNYKFHLQETRALVQFIYTLFYCFPVENHTFR